MNKSVFVNLQLLVVMPLWYLGRLYVGVPDILILLLRYLPLWRLRYQQPFGLRYQNRSIHKVFISSLSALGPPRRHPNLLKEAAAPQLHSNFPDLNSLHVVNYSGWRRFSSDLSSYRSLHFFGCVRCVDSALGFASPAQFPEITHLLKHSVFALPIQDYLVL